MAVHVQKSLVLPEKFGKLTLPSYDSQSSVEDPMSSCPSTPSTPSSPIDYEIKVVTTEDKETILEFLRKSFFRDEPLNKHLQLVTEDNPVCEALEDFCMKGYDDGCSLKVVHDGKIIGVCISSVVEKGFLDDEEKVDRSNEGFNKIVDLLNRVARESDVFSKFTDCDKAMVLKILSVDRAYRGKGIAKELAAKTRDFAKKYGCGFMSVDCTSHYTACAVKRLGFELVYSLGYADYKNEKGEIILQPEAPHTAVTVYVQRIK